MGNDSRFRLHLIFIVACTLAWQTVMVFLWDPFYGKGVFAYELLK